MGVEAPLGPFRGCCKGMPTCPYHASILARGSTKWNTRLRRVPRNPIPSHPEGLSARTGSSQPLTTFGVFSRSLDVHCFPCVSPMLLSFQAPFLHEPQTLSPEEDFRPRRGALPALRPSWADQGPQRGTLTLPFPCPG